MTGEDTGENVFDFFRQNEIEITDSLYAVRNEIDNDFVPDVEPFGMMVHRFGDERYARHVSESGDKILAFVFAVEFPVLNGPAGELGH